MGVMTAQLVTSASSSIPWISRLELGLNCVGSVRKVTMTLYGIIDRRRQNRMCPGTL
jgi:hypothetical protein